MRRGAPARRLALCLLAPLLTLAACSPAPGVLRFEGPTMGTRYHMTVVGAPAELRREHLEADISRVLARIDALMSTWRADSEISRFNRAPVGEWFPLSDETYAVLETSLAIHRLSERRFDVTVAPLLAAWGFGPSDTGPRIPSGEEIAAAMALTGSGALELAPDPPRARKQAQRQVELSAIAPGYAVDLVAQAFAARGLGNFMIEIGGEVRTAGHNSEGARWRIGIETPDRAPGTAVMALRLGGESVSTSGDYRDFFELDGTRYSHTMDPATGRPVTHGLASVTVIADDCMRADALATAITVLGPVDGIALAEREHVAVYMLVRDGDGFKALSSSALAPYLAAAAAADRG